ncbi:retrovirus-related pol polyprotein from transposon TNT 1-94, partial [Tanacetum coccineum]
HTQPSITQNAYPPPTILKQPQDEFPQLDSGLAVPTFLFGDDPIACMNKAMAFLSAVFLPRYPSTNNQLRSSYNPRNQATVQDGRVTVQQVQGKQGQNVVGLRSQRNASGLRGNTSGQEKFIKCYKCQGEWHMARQCTQPKRKKDAAWFKEKNWEPLSEDILGATTQRDIGRYYPKRYWELLPKEILGAITQRDTRSYYPKRHWDVL